MDLDGFWALIERSRGDEDELEPLVRALPAEELVAFTGIFDAQYRRACRWDIWEAGVLLDGGMGDDSFKDFRSWLIGRGRAVFESVLAEPDALAEIPGLLDDEYHTDEGFGGVALRVWYELHGDNPDAAASAALNAVEKAHLTEQERRFHDGAPGGERPLWPEVPALLPRLWALVGHRYDAPPGPMDLDRFWELIEWAGGREEELQILLEHLPRTDLVRFTAIFDAQDDRATRDDVWDAGALLDGGMGDDSFKDFRRWLISQGREAFDAVLAEPDALADLPGLEVDGSHRNESFYPEGLVGAYGGNEDAASAALQWAHAEVELPPVEREDVSTDESALPQRFPRLWALVAHKYR